MTLTLDDQVSQADLAELFGVSQPTISRLKRDGILPKRAPLREEIRAYIRAIEAERDALAGSADDSMEAREARLRLTNVTVKLRERQAALLARRYERDCRAFIERALGEVSTVLYRKIPTATVQRLLTIIPLQEHRYHAADAFRAVIGEAVNEVLDRGFDVDGFPNDPDDEHSDPDELADEVRPTRRPTRRKTTKGKRA